MNAPFPSEDADLALSAMQRQAVAGDALRLRRLTAFVEASHWRCVFFALKRKLDRDPWFWTQLGWGDGGERTIDEEMKVIRENWTEALWGMNRHVY